MTIGEYRNQLREDIRTATEGGFYPAAQACLTLLTLIQGLSEEAPADFLTFTQIAFVGQEAMKLANAAYEEGRIQAEERPIIHMRFFAHAEASKLRGIPIDTDVIGLKVETCMY